MYYEEKMVDGVLCWRGAPDGEWTPYSAQHLSARLERAQQIVAKMRAILAEED